MVVLNFYQACENNENNEDNKIENILTGDIAKNLISDCLDNGFKFKDEFQGYFIWIS